MVVHHAVLTCNRMTTCPGCNLPLSLSHLHHDPELDELKKMDGRIFIDAAD